MTQPAPAPPAAALPGEALMKRLIAKMCDGGNLSREEAEAAMVAILEGAATPTQYAGFLTALRMKGETIEEITGFASVMRARCATIAPKVGGRLIDTCGTGGAPVKTFNVSTISAFVAAGAGVPVAKHGNRAVTSPCGSADVLEALGANLALDPADVARIIERVGVGFLFAPNFHPAMRHAAGPRRELGIRTVFNILGPLTNPAGAKGQVLGVFHPSLVPKLTPVLANLGVERAMVVHGEGGLDEVSPLGPTRVGYVESGEVRYGTLTPEELGFARCAPEDVAGADKETSAKIARDVLAGKAGPRLDTVLLNAACALYVGGRVASVAEGVAAARDAIDTGKAGDCLASFVEATKR